MSSQRKNRSIIVRNRSDQSQQIQIVVDYEDQTIGVIQNKGMEMIIIDSVITKDFHASYTTNPADPFVTQKVDFGKIRVGDTDRTDLI